MSSRDDEQQVLDAIENQLRTEDPQLMECFSALGGATLPVRPVNGWERRAPYKREARRGRHRRADRRRHPIVIDFVLVILAVLLVVMLEVGAMWMFTAIIW